jgi:hypothetical protein
MVILFLPIGGVVLGLGWLVVMILLWTSRRWTPREKLIATVALPGGPWIAFFGVEAISATQLPLPLKVPLFVVGVSLLLIPTAAAIYLGIRAWPRGRLSAARG